MSKLICPECGDDSPLPLRNERFQCSECYTTFTKAESGQPAKSYYHSNDDRSDGYPDED